jgi:mono/diheme cytochrome c family protein
MMNRRYTIPLAVAALAFAGGTPLAADAGRGRKLVAAHCGECHDDGVYRSPQRKATNLATVRQQIESGALALGLNWSGSEIADVEQYLNQTFYKY